ncbi:MAG: aminotransferase class III-fold pyridoxal phosphate-dependent enzyme, partial [Candidatus Atribacteria bacterium]|nr:aminotransferase class III-fold pyridoxal phosphate-dependent enzyme [Candidatus Atribacteria bacterium]
YLKHVKTICEKQGALLILDEIQTGLGRTGKMFACEHFDVVPDIMTLAKGLGGGVLPLGAFISTAEIWKVFEENPFIHSSTLGGNPLSCVAGIETLKILQEENIPELTRIKGEKVLQHLSEIQVESQGMIQEVRGMGLLIGIQFRDPDIASLVAMEMARRHVLVAYTLNNPTVIRIEPPLTITFEELEIALSRLTESLVSVQSLLDEIEGG